MSESLNTTDYRQLLEKVFKENPLKEALVFQGRTYTYQEIDKESRKVQLQIEQSGLTNSHVIALLASRKIETLFSLFGVIRSGLAFLPIDSRSPQERIDYIINASGAEYFIDDTQNINKTFNDCSNFGSIDAKENKLAYLIYTSGSTGKPKGIKISKSALNHFIYAFNKEVKIGPGRIVLSSTSLSFDISILETLIAFVLGSKVIFSDDNENKNPNSIVKLITNNNVDLVQFTPSMMKLLVRKQVNFLRDVKDVLIGGEKFDEALYKAVKSNTSANIYNVYGPTEATIWASIKRLSSIEEPVTIGKPLTDTKFLVVDGTNVLADGEIGEIAISSPQLAIGYTDQALTDQKFLSDLNDENDRVYLTGDLGYVMPDGEFQIIGRKDDQVKINGNRVELNEIKNCIVEIPKVRDAAVCYVPTQDEVSGHLCSIIIKDGEISENQIIKELKKTLPSYMVPSYVEFSSTIPLNINGKVDIPALSKHFKKALIVGENKGVLNISSSDELTIRVLEIFNNACGVDLQEGMLDRDINNIGIDSFKFANLLMAIEDELDIDFEQSVSIYGVKSVREIVEVCRTKIPKLAAV
ncbi:non-ribosomal peptide synthetase [Vibrio lentus]|uniref:non-ribosomal peptide synthetase n=1 Tax=Vibrio lentus TaxID=136468 RepID=UPI000C85C4E6|nr:non-ribosomal peptide synthetase [Vibrio lentus]PMG78017.1 hypothetical protein BCU86_21095 [Vibrio lentus]